MTRLLGAALIAATMTIGAVPSFAAGPAPQSDTAAVAALQAGVIQGHQAIGQRALVADCGCGGGSEDVLDDLLGDLGGALISLLNALV